MSTKLTVKSQSLRRNLRTLLYIIQWGGNLRTPFYLIHWGGTSEHSYISCIEEPLNIVMSHSVRRNLRTPFYLIHWEGTSEHCYTSFNEGGPQKTVIFHLLSTNPRTPSYLIHWEELQNTNISQSWKRNLWTHLSFIEDNPKNTVPPRLCITSHGYSISVIWS